jgi:hypothetical protein
VRWSGQEKNLLPEGVEALRGPPMAAVPR